MTRIIPYRARGKTRYRINVRRDGVRHQERFQTKVEAEEYVRRLDGGELVESTSLRNAMAKYLRWTEQTQEKKRSTIATDSARLHVFLRWAAGAGIDRVSQITPVQLRLFMEYFFENHPFFRSGQRRSNPNPSSTWNRYRCALSVFFSFCQERGMIAVNPIKGRKEFIRKEQRKVPHWFRDEELYALWQYFDERDTALVATWYRFLPMTGLRLSEALDLTWDSLNLSDALINIDNDTKSYRARVVPINQALLPWLDRLPRGVPGGLVFGNGPRHYFHHSTWNHKLQVAKQALNIGRGNIHSFRHSFGTGLARAGVGPLEIKRLMGHADIQTSMKYIHAVSPDLKTPVAKLPFCEV